MAGYTRNDTANNIADGNIINASDLDGEFDAIQGAFSGANGHSHDGTTGNGPQLTASSLANNAVVTAKIQDSAVTPAKIDPTGTYTVTGLNTSNLTIGSSATVTSVDTDLSSVSATDNSLASAKAIKSYVDAQIALENELTELNDVTISSVDDNEVLAYNSASSKWINQTAVEAGLQPNDAGLTSIAGLATSANQMIYTTGSDTYATTSLTEAGRAILDDADASTQRTTLGLAIGTDVQAYSANLATIAGLAVTDGNIIVGNGTNWVAESGDTARASLGLAIGTNVQAYSAKLAAIAGLAVTDGNIIVGNGTTWAAESGDTARTSLGLAIGSNVQAYNANLTTIGALSPTDGNFIVGSGTAWVAESGDTVRTSLGLSIGSNVQAHSANLDTLAALSPTDSNFIVGNGTAWVAESGDTVRTSLGLAIGSDVQAYNANLATIGALTPTDSNFIVGNGTDWVAESGDTVRTSLGLAIGTNVQAYDAGLTSIAGLTTAADKMIYTTDLDVYAVADLTAAGRSLIAGVDASAQRTTLGLGGLAILSAVGAAQITDNSVGAAELNVSGNGTTTQFLRSDGDGTFTWATPADTNTTYSAGDLLDLDGTTFNVDLSELTTSTTDGDGDYFAVIDTANAQRKLTKSSIKLSGFSNDLTVGSFTNDLNYLRNIIEDTTPQLGGDLDVQNFSLTTGATNGNVLVELNGSGNFEVAADSSNRSEIVLYSARSLFENTTPNTMSTAAGISFEAKDKDGVDTEYAYLKVNGNGASASSGALILELARIGYARWQAMTWDGHNDVIQAHLTQFGYKSAYGNNYFSASTSNGFNLIGRPDYTNFKLILTSNITLGNPSINPVRGNAGVIIFIQDATGNRTVSLSNYYETADAGGLVLSTAPNSVTIVPWYARETDKIVLGTPIRNLG